MSAMDDLDRLLSEDPRQHAARPATNGDARAFAAGGGLPRTARWMPNVSWAGIIGEIGIWLIVASFGGVVWAINGGFSVLGLEEIARSFNTYGMIFWSLMSAWTFEIPAAAKANLPAVQPVLPWVGVVGASLVQIVVIFMRIMKQKIPGVLVFVVFLVSLYDLGTTYRGTGAVSWLAEAPVLARGVLSILITFVFEAIVGFLLGRLARHNK